jgi:predicted nucleic acid-binding protein
MVTLIERLRDARLVCIDTAPFIYFLQESAPFSPAVAPLFAAIQRGEKRGLSSFVTLLEILVRPIKENRQDLVREYSEILLSADCFELVEVGRAVATEAAGIRASYGFKTADAIQLATARLSGADAFLTNDTELSRFVELDVVLVSGHLDLSN